MNLDQATLSVFPVEGEGGSLIGRRDLWNPNLPFQERWEGGIVHSPPPHPIL